MKISISAIAIWKQQPDRTTEIKYQTLQIQLRASPAGLTIWPWENISHIQVLVTYFFPTPPISLKMGLQIGGGLLIATHLDQSKYLANQKQGAVNKCDLTVFIKLFQGSESCAFFQGHSSLPVTPLGCTSSKVSSARSHSECRWRCS
jgi:hypothetical protein